MVKLNGLNYETETMRSERPVLIGFCSGTAPYEALEALAVDFAPQYKFCAVDVERERELTRHFSILKPPTLILMQEGEIQQRICQIPNTDALKKMLDFN